MKKIALAFALLAVASCQGYPFVTESLTTTAETRSTVFVNSSGTVDILFVIDNSGSMADKQANLQRNAATFINAFAATNLDYHLGIVTTDMFAPTDGGRLRMVADTSQSQPFWSSPSVSDPNAGKINATIISEFERTVASLGTKGNLNEAGLLAVLKAVNPQDANVVALNNGFIRPQADLAVVVLTDEDDCSFTPDNFQTVAGYTDDQDCYLKTSVLYSPNDLVTQFANLKGGNLGRVRFGIIAGGLTNPDGSFEPRSCVIDAQGNASAICGCWSPRPDEASFCESIHQDFNQPCTTAAGCTNSECAGVPGGACNTPLCHSTPARRYTQFLNSFSKSRTANGLSAGTVVDTVCQNEYAASLLKIAQTVVLSSCFSLPSAAASADQVSVTLAHTQPGGGLGPQNPLMRYDPTDPNAQCHSCSDCQGNAWQYIPGAGICFACNLQTQPGDNVQVGVLVDSASQP